LDAGLSALSITFLFTWCDAAMSVCGKCEIIFPRHSFYFLLLYVSNVVNTFDRNKLNLKLFTVHVGLLFVLFCIRPLFIQEVSFISGKRFKSYILLHLIEILYFCHSIYLSFLNDIAWHSSTAVVYMFY
jgi:hypothetical protein